MMICCVVSSINGTKSRVVVDGKVSMPLIILEHIKDIKVGDSVCCYFTSASLSDGFIVGKVVV